MLFSELYECDERSELILVEGGVCCYHLCHTKQKKGQVTIRVIFVSRERRSEGIGTRILNQLKQVEGAISLFAKCPSHLESNGWYAQKGFVLEGTEKTRNGGELNLWRLNLQS